MYNTSKKFRGGAQAPSSQYTGYATACDKFWKEINRQKVIHVHQLSIDELFFDALFHEPPSNSNFYNEIIFIISLLDISYDGLKLTCDQFGILITFIGQFFAEQNKFDLANKMLHISSAIIEEQVSLY